MENINPCQLHDVLRDISMKNDLVIQQRYGMRPTVACVGIASVVGAILGGPVGLVVGGSLTLAGMRWCIKKKVSVVSILDSFGDEDKQKLYDAFKLKFQTIVAEDNIALGNIIVSNVLLKTDVMAWLKVYVFVNKTTTPGADSRGKPLVVIT